MFVGCDTQTQTDDSETGLTFLSELPVVIDYKGGEVIVNFKIINPNPDNILTAVSPAEWISEPIVKESGIIVFEVARNNTKYGRDAIIKILYGSDFFDLPVEQSARSEEEYTYNMNATVFGGEYYGFKNSKQFNYFVQLGNGEISENNDAPNATYYYFDIYSNRRGGDHPILPNGTYTIDTTMKEENLDPDSGKYSKLFTKAHINDENGEPVEVFQVNGGTITVTDNRFEAHLTMADGTIHNVVYEGELYVPNAIDDTPASPLTVLTEDFEITKNGAALRVLHYGDSFGCGLSYTIVEAMEVAGGWDGEYFAISILTDLQTTGISLDDIIGEYPAGSDLDLKKDTFLVGLMESWKWLYTWRFIPVGGYIVNRNGGFPLVDGNIKIEKDGATSSIVTIDCVDDANHKVKAIFNCASVEIYDLAD